MAARAAVARWSRPSEAVRLLLSGAMTRPCLAVALVVSTVLGPVDHADAVFRRAARGAVTLKGARQVRKVPHLGHVALLAVHERRREPRPDWCAVTAAPATFR